MLGLILMQIRTEFIRAHKPSQQTPVDVENQQKAEKDDGTK